MKTTFHPDLLLAQKLVYEPLGLHRSEIIPEAESQEYSACRFTINNKRMLFRVAKTTPTKSGQFVTIWKRMGMGPIMGTGSIESDGPRVGDGPIMPFDLSDPVDLFVISVRNAENFGQFVFPKDVLAQEGYVSKHNSGGKRAIRVYPPWVVTDSAQARKTQAWQINYFCEIESDVDKDKMQKLLR